MVVGDDLGDRHVPELLPVVAEHLGVSLVDLAYGAPLRVVEGDAVLDLLEYLAVVTRRLLGALGRYRLAHGGVSEQRTDHGSPRGVDEVLVEGFLWWRALQDVEDPLVSPE